MRVHTKVSTKWCTGPETQPGLAYLARLPDVGQLLLGRALLKCTQAQWQLMTNGSTPSCLLQGDISAHQKVGAISPSCNLVDGLMICFDQYSEAEVIPVLRLDLTCTSALLETCTRG